MEIRSRVYDTDSDLYVVRRKKSVLTLNIARLRMEDLIARAAWPGLPGSTIGSDIGAGKRVPTPLYLSGLVLKQDGPAVIVDDIIPQSPAEEVGIQPGDLVLKESPGP